MSSRIGLFAVMVAVLLCLAGSAQAATTLLTDNFEGYTDVATSWNDGLDHDPTGLPGVLWNSDEPAASAIQVMANPATGAFTTPYGSKYLHIADSGIASAFIDSGTETTNQTLVKNNKNVHLEADIYNAGGTSAGNFGLELFKGGKMLCELNLLQTGVTGYANPGVPLSTVSFPMDTWNHVAIDADFTTHKWSATVNGVTVGNLGFYELDAGGVPIDTITRAQFETWNRNDVYVPYIGVDNVLMSTITTPEPSCTALCGAGLLGLLAYAWRKR
jgi:hypothetical protein